MHINETIKFKPNYSPEVELVLGDGFSFQWSDEDEDGGQNLNKLSKLA